jgi:hypothetical protein
MERSLTQTPQLGSAFIIYASDFLQNPTDVRQLLSRDQRQCTLLATSGYMDPSIPRAKMNACISGAVRWASGPSLFNPRAALPTGTLHPITVCILPGFWPVGGDDLGCLQYVYLLPFRILLLIMTKQLSPAATCLYLVWGTSGIPHRCGWRLAYWRRLLAIQLQQIILDQESHWLRMKDKAWI